VTTTFSQATRTISTLLQSGLQHDVGLSLGDPPPLIRIGAPRSRAGAHAEHEACLSLFLYRVTEPNALRNLPSRVIDPRSRPPVLFDLHYLVSADAEDELRCQDVLAAVGTVLLRTPVVATPRLTISGTTLSTAELSGLWSALRVPWQLSLTFVVSGVTIE
jgi:hypothetical protein